MNARFWFYSEKLLHFSRTLLPSLTSINSQFLLLTLNGRRHSWTLRENGKIILKIKLADITSWIFKFWADHQLLIMIVKSETVSLNWDWNILLYCFDFVRTVFLHFHEGAMGVLIYAFGYPGIVSFPRKLRYLCLVAWEKHVALTCEWYSD